MHIIFQILTLFCWAGLIGIGEPKSLLTASAALNAFHVPVIAVDPAVFSQVIITMLEKNGKFGRDFLPA